MGIISNNLRWRGSSFRLIESASCSSTPLEDTTPPNSVCIYTREIVYAWYGLDYKSSFPKGCRDRDGSSGTRLVVTPHFGRRFIPVVRRDLTSQVAVRVELRESAINLVRELRERREF